jgi:hypothetical protein
VTYHLVPSQEPKDTVMVELLTPRLVGDSLAAVPVLEPAISG